MMIIVSPWWPPSERVRTPCSVSQRPERDCTHRARGGNVDGVVQVEAEHLAFRLHHADHAVALTADAQVAAERVLPGEQLLPDLRAEHDKGACLLRVVRGQ